jgi:dTDP-4-amino-4,6-dideoxygalactose transaminase
MRYIGFNIPFIAGNEINYIMRVIKRGKLSGNGEYTNKCQTYFETKYSFTKCLLTSSCTDALEMAALLCDIQHGDEVIIPSFTFISTANAFVLRGAKIIFADSCPTHPNIDHTMIENLITSKTKALVVIHYAGIACNMDAIMSIAEKYNLFVVEDAAHCIDSYYMKKPLGSIGHFGAFSFHETKNITSGEGGMLTVNQGDYVKRAGLLWEKGSNRAAFSRGEVEKYSWVDYGSSYLPSEITAAFLYAQVESINIIEKKRRKLWRLYYDMLNVNELKGKLTTPNLPKYATSNGHLFYIVCKSNVERTRLIQYLHDNNIQAIFHYTALHQSPFYLKNNPPVSLPNAEMYSDCLLRLPLHYRLKKSQVRYICNKIRKFYLSANQR